jgi:formate hydrogenlyase subunit 4
MNWSDLASQVFQTALAVAAAPLLLGWVSQCRAWLQNRTGPGVLQPYRVLFKLLQKDAVIAHNASWLFRLAPYVVFACMVLSVSIVPLVATDLPFALAADVIALVGLLALARVFMALAAMDVGTAFGSLGARREMLIACLAEPALLMVFFTPALISQSTELTVIVDQLAHRELRLYPSMAFAAVAFLMVLLAENARIPVDNPATHLELTMVHEAMVLEYSGRHLALIEWAASLKLLLYISLLATIFAPWGIATFGAGFAAASLALIAYLGKLGIGGALLAVFEVSIAKMRVFRVPEFLGAAVMLGLLATLLRMVVRGL